MIWLTWRQFRAQFLVLVAGLAVLAAVLSVTGPGLLHAFNADARGFLRQISGEQSGPVLYLVGIAVLYAVPPVIGAFWGAPLVARELEAGTHRLAWNQGVTRSRWLAGKLAVIGLTAVAVTGALSLVVTWWAEPIDTAVAAGDQAGPFELPRMYPLIFAARGLVPVGYAAFAFVLGVAVGLLLRRTVAAIAVTLVVMVAVQLAMPIVVREHLATPRRDVIAITGQNMVGIMIRGGGGSPPEQQLQVEGGDPGDWLLSSETIDAAGAVQASAPGWTQQCGGPIGTARFTEAEQQKQQACFTRLKDEGFRQELRYQPASMFWTLQWRETALLLVLAGLLTGLCFWRINRDLT